MKLRDLVKVYSGEVSVLHLFDEVFFGYIEDIFESEDKWILDSEVYSIDVIEGQYLEVVIRN